ncbi:hypothetical protein EG829_22740, partial [bacterium]|nr:hypothetical protein [bacterium]
MVRLGAVFSGTQVDASGHLVASTQVDANADLIRFSSVHNLSNGQRIFYGYEGTTPMGGLTAGQEYYAYVIDDKTIKLYNSFDDATFLGVGVHPELVNSSTNVIDTMYTHGFAPNQAVTYLTPHYKEFASGSVDATNNIITIREHGFSNGQEVSYRSESGNVPGLANGNKYYVALVDVNSFRLCTTQDNLEDGIYIDLGTPSASSKHYLSNAGEVPISGLAPYCTYYVDVVSDHELRLLSAPGGTVIDINAAGIGGSHGLRAAGVEVSGLIGTTPIGGLHYFYYDLYQPGTGTQYLIGAGGIVSASAQQGSDGISRASASGT